MNQVEKENTRIDWVDHAKGICIIFVVMMHSTLGIEKHIGQTGWMHYLVEWARPFRMPDFFLIAGLFLANVIDRNWRQYFDRKVLHFAYFYSLWAAIQFGIKSPINGAEYGWSELPNLYLRTFFHPYSTLWFIYILPIMFVITKLLKPIAWPIVLGLACLLEILPIDSDILLVDEFASRYVYFFIGYAFAQNIFRLAGWAQKNQSLSLMILFLWMVINGLLVFNNYATLPLVSLVSGFMGALAIILAASLLAKVNFARAIGYIGSHSLVVYVAFFLPMGITRIILVKLEIISNIGVMSVITTIISVAVPFILFWIVQKFNIGCFLFTRPDWAILKAK